jgi:hypothetical protein
MHVIATLGLLIGIGLPIAVTARLVRTESPQTPVNADAKAMADFQERVKTYLDVRNRLAGSLAKLPEKATPEQIDTRQRALGKAVITARKNAKVGDIFGADFSDFVKRQFAPVFKGPDGVKLRAAIFDEPHPAVPAINARYPDEVPLSTMPPEVLKVLPKLEIGLEFRFIGYHLILLDVDSHLIADLIPNAMPSGGF